jgi:hypothetical protein
MSTTRQQSMLDQAGKTKDLKNNEPFKKSLATLPISAMIVYTTIA